ncbi:MAG: hypothetical protein JXI43_06335 [Tissierellales bacterium]|nr:hypothetical protein [Tissierellales bacterium]
MNTAKIFKQEISNVNIWNLLLIELGLPPDSDEMTVKAVACSSESKRSKQGDKDESNS